MTCSKYLSLLAFIVAMQPSLAREASSVSSKLMIKDYLELATQKNEVTRINASQKEQFEAKKDQALATVLPQLKLAGNYTQQEQPAGTKPEDAKSTTARVNLSQPLLGLYKGSKTLGAAKKQLEATELSGEDALLQFRLSVNDAFHAAITAEKDLDGYDDVQKIAAKRVKEISERVKIGRSKPADLYAAQAQLATADAQLEQAKTAVYTSKSALAQISGVEFEAEIFDGLNLPAKTDAVDNFLADVSKMPALKALEAQKEASAVQVDAIRAQRIPDIDLAANYYLQREKRLKDIKWDVGLQLNWPIYDGGMISGKVREASSQKAVYEEQLSQKRRLTELKIKQYHQMVEASLRQLPIFERAVTMAQKNYDSIAKDYRLGLATVLDLIQSSNALADARRALNRQTITAKSLFVALQLSSGRSL